MFGNVNVDYKPCKSQIQLDRASRYMLGELPEQQQAGVIKTAPHLCWEMNCDRNIYSCDILTTRKLFGKRDNKRTNLAFKMSLSFSPDDNDKLTYEEVFNIAKEFAEKFFDGYQVMFAVHTDKPHKHVHFLVGNCHIETGKAYRRSQKDLQTMCEFFGEQCMKRSLTNSVRRDYYNDSPERDKETFAEKQMKAKGKETFKDELREVIRIECADSNNKTLEDVVAALMKHYHVECRVKGNTISYRHPEYTDKNGKLVSVRGSKLGDKYTVKGINYELSKKQRERADEQRRTAERDLAEESVLHKGDASQRGGTPEKTKQQFTYITGAVGGVRAGTVNGGNADSNSSAEHFRDQGESGRASRSDGCEHTELQNGRESASHGIGGSANVRSFDELFREYEQRNGTSERKRPAKSEPARTVRQKRQDRGL